MAQQDDFQRLYELLAEQDKVMSQMQDLLRDYQRNHSEMNNLHQKLRSPLQTQIPDEEETLNA